MSVPLPAPRPSIIRWRHCRRCEVGWMEKDGDCWSCGRRGDKGPLTSNTGAQAPAR